MKAGWWFVFNVVLCAVNTGWATTGDHPWNAGAAVICGFGALCDMADIRDARNREAAS